MKKSREDVRRDIADLHLPMVMLRLFDGEGVPKRLRMRYACPEAFFLLSEAEQLAITGRTVKLLFDDGAFGLLLGFDEERKGFVRFLSDGSTRPQELVPRDWLSLMLEDFNFFWEDEASDEELEELAGLLGFEWIERFLLERPKVRLNSFAELENWFQGFRSEGDGQ